MTTQPVVGVKAAAVTKLTSLLPSAQVSYGSPTDITSDDVVVLGNAAVQVDFPTFNHQQHDIDLDIAFSSWRAGDATLQQTATEAALVMFETFVAYLRATPTNPLALTDLLQVGRSLCSSYTVEETPVAEEAMYGRLATVSTTLHICVRPS